ncbi:uncharacterized protein MELLADRAFT_103189 [Melampsora larici-populina 98AG31]|uniref:Uncharacterized protein n=1 Tax=Melampsora larici-populina (strain 98AG31 / pathotype 3-4-7) TaxID=747676 RepID=F4RAV0_MELLP|nr:uncharacterized protein MELLADRAFT_103189 [Melampsora larici-populina 98AG31]EGG10540.1 hypothetical protein MELLADRAFT_103189 [Melampsora larici-populina 98AG31]
MNTPGKIASSQDHKRTPTLACGWRRHLELFVLKEKMKMLPRRLTLRPQEFSFEGSQDSGLPLKLVTTRHGTKISNPSRLDESGKNSTQHIGNQSSSRRARGNGKGSPPAWLERALEVPEHGQSRTSDTHPSSRTYPSFHRPVPRRPSRHPHHHRSLATIDSSASRRIESRNYGSGPTSSDHLVSSPRITPQMLPPFLAYHPHSYPTETLHEHNSPTPLLAYDGVDWEDDQAPDHSQSRLSFQTWPEEQLSQRLEYDSFPPHLSQPSPLLSLQHRNSQFATVQEREWQRRSPTEPTTLYNHLPVVQTSYQRPQSPSQSLQSLNVYSKNPEPDRYLLKLESAAKAFASSEAGFSSPLGCTLPIDGADGFFDSSTRPKYGAFNFPPTTPRARSLTSHQSNHSMYPRTPQHLNNVEASRQVSQETAEADYMAFPEPASSHRQQPLKSYETLSPTHTTWSDYQNSTSLNVWQKHPQLLGDPLEYGIQSNENLYEDELSNPDILAQTQTNLTTFSEIQVSRKPYNEQRNEPISPTFFVAEEDKAVFAELKALATLGTTSIDHHTTISAAQVSLSPSISVAATEEIQREVEEQEVEEQEVEEQEVEEQEVEEQEAEEPGDWARLEQLLEEYPESNVDFDEDGSGPGFVIWQDPDIP